MCESCGPRCRWPGSLGIMAVMPWAPLTNGGPGGKGVTAGGGGWGVAAGGGGVGAGNGNTFWAAREGFMLQLGAAMSGEGRNGRDNTGTQAPGGMVGVAAIGAGDVDIRLAGGGAGGEAETPEASPSFGCACCWREHSSAVSF